MKIMHANHSVLVSIALVLLVAACGGGGGSSESESPSLAVVSIRADRPSIVEDIPVADAGGIRAWIECPDGSTVEMTPDGDGFSGNCAGMELGSDQRFTVRLTYRIGSEDIVFAETEGFVNVTAGGAALDILASDYAMPSMNGNALNNLDMLLLGRDPRVPWQPASTIEVEPHSTAAIVRSGMEGAEMVNLHYGTRKDIDAADCGEATDCVVRINVNAEETITGLNNGQMYYFRTEGIYPAGSRVQTRASGARPNYWATHDGLGSSAVVAQAFDGEGNHYIGGRFHQIGVYSGPVAALTDAVRGSGLEAFPVVEGLSVSAVVPDGVGGWYVAGTFEKIGGLEQSNLAHVLPSGEVDPNWRPAADSWFIYDLAVIGDFLYVARDGWVERIDSAGVPSSCRFEIQGRVYNLAVSGETLYMGGDIERINGQTRNGLAAINHDCTLLGWNPGPASEGGFSLFDMLVVGETIYVSGWFTSIAGRERSRLAALDTDGNVTDWNPRLDDAARSMVAADGVLYLGGFFTQVNGEDRNHLAAVRLDDGSLTEWAPHANDWVYALDEADGLIYAGGLFTTINDDASHRRLVAIRADGTPVDGWGRGVSSYVLSLAVENGMVAIGGWFSSVNSHARGNLAAIRPDGTLRQDWDWHADRDVYSLAVQGQTVYVGGDFQSLNEAPRRFLAAIGTDGSLRDDWAPRPDGAVFALAVSGQGLYVGGGFAAIGDQISRNIALLDSRGRLHSAWSPPAFAQNVSWLNTLALSPAGDMLYAGFGSSGVAGGLFVEEVVEFCSILSGTCPPPSPPSVFAIRTSDGGIQSSWMVTKPCGETPFGVSGDCEGSVYALALSSDGRTLYAGGDFSRIGTQARTNLAAISTVNNTLTAWAPSLNGRVYSLAVSDDMVYAGGDFDFLLNFNGEISEFGTRYAHLAKIQATDGALRSDWRPLADGPVSTVLLRDQKIHVGGWFRGIGGNARPGLATIDTQGVLQ